MNQPSLLASFADWFQIDWKNDGNRTVRHVTSFTYSYIVLSLHYGSEQPNVPASKDLLSHKFGGKQSVNKASRMKQTNE